MTLSPADLRSLAAVAAASLPDVGRALWHDAQGDWATAHRIVQDRDDSPAAWVHAYLHRKDGDLSNAAYWYRRAGQPVATGSLDDEWEVLARAVLR